MCFCQLLQEPTKLLDQAYRCLYTLIGCPTEGKDKLPLDRMYYVLAEACNLDTSSQDKFITILKIVSDISETFTGCKL